MDLHARYCQHGEQPGRYMFLAGPPKDLPAVEILDPGRLAYWEVGFRRWITETEDMIARKLAGKPMDTDWEAPIEKMQAHVKRLLSEMRSPDRQRLFVLPFEAPHGD